MLGPEAEGRNRHMVTETVGKALIIPQHRAPLRERFHYQTNDDVLWVPSLEMMNSTRGYSSFDPEPKTE
jgi:hypothetical protein